MLGIVNPVAALANIERRISDLEANSNKYGRTSVKHSRMVQEGLRQIRTTVRVVAVLCLVQIGVIAYLVYGQ